MFGHPDTRKGGFATFRFRGTVTVRRPRNARQQADSNSGPLQPKVQKFSATLDFLIVGLTLLAPTLGGATKLWTQALLILGAAVLVLLAPPEHPLRWWVNFLLAGLLLLAFVPLLPASWFAPFAWRDQLRQQFQINPAGTLSLQPWLTLEKAGLLLGGLVWASFLLTRRWTISRLALLELYAGGVLFLTAAALIVHFSGFQSSLWEIEAGNFGFFPHRNQTANLLALGSIICLALAWEQYRQKGRRVIFWTAAFVLIGVALVVNYSRAGILLYFFGSLLWLAWVSRFSRNYFGLGLGVAGLFFLLALFISFGGQTWERFRPEKADQGSPELDFRVLLQKDALALARPASWHGLGLGNFEPAFAQHRVRSLIENRARHPDSDWLWLWIEMGWTALLLALGAVVLLLRDCWPFAPGTDRRLRAAATLCVILFILHGFVDVSAHRMGTLWPAIFLLSQARNPAAHPDSKRWCVRAFRALAVVLAILSLGWLASPADRVALPTSGWVASLKARINQASEQKNFAAVIDLATQALAVAPLDYQLYFNRAAAWALDVPDGPGAPVDFQRAGHLEPNSSAVPFQEGILWLGSDPERTLAAWQEALRRAGKNAADLYQLMLLHTAGFPQVRAGLWTLTGSNVRLKLMFLQSVTGDAFTRSVEDWFETDRRLRAASPAQLKELFALWAAKGDRAELEKKLLAHPDWMEEGAVWLAEFEADRKNFKGAYEMARRYRARPKLPPMSQPLGQQKSLAKLQKEFQSRPRDFSAGLALFATHMNLQDYDGGLATLQQLTKLPQCPKYFFYLEAELLAQKQQWEEAWLAWKKFARE